MKQQAFDRNEHVYRNDAFAELVKDAIRFFNGTPVHSLPPPQSFLGTGVYALYYIGQNPLYKRYSELNRLSYDCPIYIGKAVPRGWRQARLSDNPFNQSRELISRLREHTRSIILGAELSIDEFMCRFVIFEEEGSDMISTIEAALIKLNRPLWIRLLMVLAIMTQEVVDMNKQSQIGMLSIKAELGQINAMVCIKKKK